MDMREQYEMVDLSDGMTLCCSFLGRALMEECGKQGELALRKAVRKWGLDRGVTEREKHLAANYKINMQSLFSVGYDLPPTNFKRELQELNPQERISHTLYCPMADIWHQYGEDEIGRIYCEEFHPASYGGYAYGYTNVNLAKTITQGDEYCAFNVVLRPENLPEELKPVCFEEYDPEYTGPSSCVPGGDARAFEEFFLKMVYYFDETAVEDIGEAGRTAIIHGIQKMAEDAIVRLEKKAKEHGLDFNRRFFYRNYPIVEKYQDENLWDRFNKYGTKEIFVEHFYSYIIGKLI